MRVVSVLPSATEIVCALGHEPELVGRSAECDYPSTILSRPAVMRPKIGDSERSSSDIDARVRAVRGRGESLYEIDIGLLKRLRPDLLLTQDLCGVCSVTEDEVAEACAQAGVRPQVVSLTPRTLSGVWADVRAVARALGDPSGGERLASGLSESCLPVTRSGPRRRVAVVEWVDPPILAGLWTPEMVLAAGGAPIGPGPGEPGRRVTWEEIRREEPDLVILSPCSFSVARTRAEISRGTIAQELSRIRPRHGIYLADEAYFSRPGPRLADGVRLLSALLDGRPPPSPMPFEPWSRA